MVITAITQQQRLKSRYSVYIDEKYAFSLSADAILSTGVHNGQEISSKQLNEFKKLSADDKAYGLALSYLARRMRSEWELRDYFRRKEYETDLADQLVARLKQLGLIDDAKFAEAWVRNRRLLKSVSKRRLVQELRRKHVADLVIEQVLSEDETEETVVLRELVLRKRKLSRYQDKQKLTRYLVGQGFSYDDVRTVLREES